MSKLPKRLTRADLVVLVCDGKDCRKAGGRDVRKALKRLLRERDQHRNSLLLKTKCTGNCKRAAICGFQPANVWLSGATPEKACATLDEILDG